jgi:predicted MFS family arabinose efflux permease
VAAVLSLASSVVMVAGANSVTLLFVGRFVAGLSSGAAFAAGTAWLREVSLPPIGSADHSTAARRAAVAMTAGFALGPLLAGLLAQWAPAPTVVPYLPHVLLMIVVLSVLTNVPESVLRGVGERRVRVLALGLRNPRFRRVVAPVAPWVFAAPAIAFAFLPTITGADRAADGIAVSAAVTSVTALAGMLIQPLARRLEARASNRAGAVGLTLLGVGLALAGATAQAEEIWMLVPTGVVLGSAYGLCLVSGLAEVQRIADQDSVGALTAAYYALAYLGFAAPFLLTLAAPLAGYPVLLVFAAVLPLATLAALNRGSVA